MINIGFFNKMRSKLLEAFSPEEYTREELKILFSNSSILHSEYCSQAFREGAIAYYEENKADIGAKFTISQKGIKPSETLICKILSKYTKEEALEYVSSLNPNEQGIYTLEAMGSYSLEQGDLQNLQKLINSFNMTSEDFAKALETADYYASWSSSHANAISCDIIGFIHFFNRLSGSVDSALKLLESLGSAETFDLLYRDAITIGWNVGEAVYEFLGLKSEQKAFYQDLINLKGIGAISSIISLVARPEVQEQFFLKYSRRELTPENIEGLFSELSELVDIDKADINLPENMQGFDVEKFLLLAKKYQMPKFIMEKLIKEEMPKFNINDDNLLTLLSWSESSGGAAAVDRTFSMDLGKIGSAKNARKYHLELLPKTDPTALFIGIIIGTCQHYTGDSSEQAVIPVYTDANAGLFVVKRGDKIVASSFAFLTKNGEGKVDGLMLESLERKAPEIEKVFLPFIKNIATSLAEKGLKLYLCAGGTSPMLEIEDEGEFKTLESIKQPTALSEGFEAYLEQAPAYLIEAGMEYRAKFQISQVYIQKFITDSLSDLSIAEREDIGKKFSDIDDLWAIAKYCKEKEYDLKVALQVYPPDVHRFHSSILDENLQLQGHQEPEDSFATTLPDDTIISVLGDI